MSVGEGHLRMGDSILCSVPHGRRRQGMRTAPFAIINKSLFRDDGMSIHARRDPCDTPQYPHLRVRVMVRGQGARRPVHELVYKSKQRTAPIFLLAPSI